MPGNTVRDERKSWAVTSGALALVTMAGLTLACHRKTPIASPTPAPPHPPAEAQRPSEEPVKVLVWMESTPPGARIALVSRNQGLGWTPEIVELGRSEEPVLIRFELEGYLPVTHDVSATTDSELKIVLKPIPVKHRHGVRKPRN